MKMLENLKKLEELRMIALLRLPDPEIELMPALITSSFQWETYTGVTTVHVPPMKTWRNRMRLDGYRKPMNCHILIQFQCIQRWYMGRDMIREDETLQNYEINKLDVSNMAVRAL